MLQNCINLILSIFCVSTFLNTCWADERIIGGDLVTNRTQFAYQVSLRYNDEHICGGAIIDNTTILTTATCSVDNNGTVLPYDKLSVISGSLRLKPLIPSKSKVVNITVHKDFTFKTLANDIALWTLAQPLKYTSNVANIRRVTKSPKTNETCVVSGWGTQTSSDQVLSSDLLYAEILIQDINKCKEDSKKLNVTLPSKMICAGANHKNPCRGDVGAPLVCNGNLAGIVSFGGCELEVAYYTDVNSFQKWIDSNSALSFKSHTPLLLLVGLMSYLLFSWQQ